MSVPNQVEDLTFDALMTLLDDYFKAGINAVYQNHYGLT